MPKFLVEVTHAATPLACARIVKTFLETGSHYLVNADWGCDDGEHKCWMIVETPTREEAKNIVPPPMRSDAKVIELGRFTMEEVDEMIAQHGG
jgi:hypothetical protein